MTLETNTLHYAGIDEAGYGPMLGPLCVAASSFLVSGWASGSKAPDLWELLAHAVTRSPRAAANRIPIDDSKKLKLANSSVSCHPLTHLERGVLTMYPQGKTCSEADLLAGLGADLDDAIWYAEPLRGWPVAHIPATLAIDRNMLHAAMQEAGVKPVSMRCMVRCERDFNRGCQESGSKAAVVGGCVSELIAELLNLEAASMAQTVRIVCDRQSGRTDYGAMVAAGACGRQVEVIAENSSGSAYRVVDPNRDIIVHFRVEAEQAHLPVALASMTAKYVRELAMARLNRYWCDRLPGLAPTAGYTTDARRWLAELGAAATSDERRRLIRQA